MQSSDYLDIQFFVYAFGNKTDFPYLPAELKRNEISADMLYKKLETRMDEQCKKERPTHCCF
jgi:hypothetical protein